MAAAKALAQSLGIGVLGATSLDILTAAAREAGHGGPVLACVDARRGEVFASVRELDAAGTRVAELVAPGLFTPAGLVAAMGALGGRGVVAVGDGARRYAEALGAVPGLDARHARTVVPTAGDAPPPGRDAARRGRTASRAGIRRSPLHA